MKTLMMRLERGSERGTTRERERERKHFSELKAGNFESVSEAGW